MKKRESSEGRIDEDDEIEKFARGERRRATGETGERIRGKFHDARRQARRYCRAVAGTNTETPLLTLVSNALYIHL